MGTLLQHVLDDVTSVIEGLENKGKKPTTWFHTACQLGLCGVWYGIYGYLYMGVQQSILNVSYQNPSPSLLTESLTSHRAHPLVQDEPH